MTIPIVIARALNLISTHPAVKKIRVLHDFDDGAVVVEIDIANELPAAWREAGESPSGVRSVETVTLGFPHNYPAFAPNLTLRADFNRSHPHINPGPANLPPQPCLVAGSPRELIQSRGIDGFIDQLVAWLDKAAMFKLNDPAIGWEPVRRDDIDDVMIVDGAKMRALATPQGGCVAVCTTFFQIITTDQQHFSIDHRSCDSIDLAKGKYSRRQIGGKAWAGDSIGLIAWPSDINPGHPFITPDYLPETVSTIRDLFDRAERYGCRIQFEGSLNLIAFGANGRNLGSIPVAITFLARRPYNLIGTDSSIELCSYLVDLQQLQDITKYDQAQVRICALREQLSIDILRRASGLPATADRPSWTLVGCGSVGSKIASHMARRGHGPTLVTDNGSMEPHNYARHALLPTQASDRGIQNDKASLLAESLAQLRDKPTAHKADIIATCDTAEGRALIAPQSLRLLLNTTASTVARERLSFLNWEHRPPIAEAHLLGAGRIAYAAFEGPGGNPSISDLAAESYRIISANERIRDRVFSAEAEAIVIGQGCSAATFPMPDDRLSALASGLSQIVGHRVQDGVQNEAEIHLAEVADDGLSQTWSRHTVAPWTIIEADGYSIRISPNADAQIRAEIAARPGTETGGVIVGRFSQIGNAFQIVDVIPAPPDSTFSPEKFVLGKLDLKLKIHTLIKNSGGSLYVLGTWHNHLVKSGPSGLDAATAIKLAIKQYFPTLLLIALPDGYTHVVAEFVNGGAKMCRMAA